MSISSIAHQASIASSFSTGTPNANRTSTLNQLRQQFQQLGQDLQSGNLSAAQSDFASLQQEASPTRVSSTPSNDPVTQALNQLQTQLQAGGLAGAPPKPVASVPIAQQGPEAPGTRSHGHGHHGHVPDPADPAPPVYDGLDELGQALQSSNLSAAQQAYNSVLQGLPLSLSNGLLSTPDVLAQSGSGVSLSA